MGLITNIKNKFRSPQQQQQEPVQQVARTSRDDCDGYYSKGNWWDATEQDYQQSKEDAFDAYARAYYSAETDEERQQLYNQDRSWMM